MYNSKKLTFENHKHYFIDLFFSKLSFIKAQKKHSNFMLFSKKNAAKMNKLFLTF